MLAILSADLYELPDLPLSLAAMMCELCQGLGIRTGRGTLGGCHSHNHACAVLGNIDFPEAQGSCRRRSAVLSLFSAALKSRAPVTASVISV